MHRLFLAGILILFGASTLPAQSSKFEFNAFCKNRVCHYELFNPPRTGQCRTKGAVGQQCSCWVTSKVAGCTNKVGVCPVSGWVQCL